MTDANPLQAYLSEVESAATVRYVIQVVTIAYSQHVPYDRTRQHIFNCDRLDLTTVNAILSEIRPF